MPAWVRYEHVGWLVGPFAGSAIERQFATVQTEILVIAQRAPVESIRGQVTLDASRARERNLAITRKQTPERALIAGKLVVGRAKG